MSLPSSWMRCWRSTSSTTIGPMFASFMSAWVHAQPEVAPGARGHAHPIVNTVTDDPECAVRSHRRAGARGHDRHLRAPARGYAGVYERVPNELRPAPAERPEPLGGMSDAHVRVGPDPVGIGNRDALAGRPRDRWCLLDPRLDDDPTEARAPGQRDADLRRRRVPVIAVDEMQARAHPFDSPPARNL